MLVSILLAPAVLLLTLTISVPTTAAIARPSIRITSAYPPCPSTCAFRFCNGHPAVMPLTLSDMSVTPAVCAHNFGRVTLSATGEARVSLRTSSGNQQSYLPLSKLSSPTLQQRFSVTLFKAYAAHAADARADGRSGLGHETVSPSQQQLLDGACVKLPVRRWQLQMYAGAPMENRWMTNTDVDCISFRVFRPRVEVRLTWAARDDLDLEVVQPNGNTMFYGTPRTTNGLFVRDVNGDRCALARLGGDEAVVLWPSEDGVNGQYFIRVRRFRRCETKTSETKFTVVARVNGVETLRESRSIGANVQQYQTGWPLTVAI